MSYRVEIRKVSGYRTQKPVVIAGVDGLPVIWDPKRGGWICHHRDCPDIETCPHVSAVEAVLWPGLFDGWDPDAA
jgi:hypothetical protein